MNNYKKKKPSCNNILSMGSIKEVFRVSQFPIHKKKNTKKNSKIEYKHQTFKFVF